MSDRIVRRRGEAPSVDDGAPSLRSRVRSIARGRSVGRSAHAIVARRATPTERATNRASTVGSANAPMLPYMLRGAMSRAGITSAGSVSAAIAAPTAPPTVASPTPSAATARAIAVGVAPSAARIASSRRRASARTMSRLETLAQASRNRKPTPPARRRTHWRSLGSTRAAFNERAVALNWSPRASRSVGAARSIAAPISRSIAAALSSVTPGASRPATLMKF